MAAGGPEGKGFRLSQIESWPRPLPRPRAIEGWTLLVTKLHKGVTKYFLREAFGEVGEVTRLRLNLDDDLGFPKGSALIEYKKFDEALAAITVLHFKGMISVEWANERDGVPIRLLRAEGTNVRRWYVLVTRVQGKVQEADLQYLFGKYGEVTSIQMNRRGYIRVPKGYAFIEYKHRKVARWAMKLWNGSDFFGDVISVRWADDHRHVYGEIPAGSSPDRLLLVTGLTGRVVAAELHRQFGIYGEIINFMTYDGILDVVEGYALIEYKRFKEAQAAISGADRNELHGQTILVNWANKMKPTYINMLFDDMMRNIFLRLPLHSIFHCSRVCKRWEHIIGDPLFADMHHDMALKNHGINPSLLFLVDGEEYSPSFLYFFKSGFKRQQSGVRVVCKSADPKMRLVRLPQLLHLHGIPRVIGSSNGLLCYGHSCHCIGVTHDVAYVTNPLTKKFARFARHCDENLGPSRLIGFGFDVNEKKFKLVSLTEEVVGGWKELEADSSAHREKKLKKELKKELKVDILTIGDDVHPDDWKQIKISQDSFYGIFPQLSDAKFSSMTMNGCLYWCYLYGSSPLIIALHMRLHLFIDIPVGDLVLTGNARFLMDWKGKLVIADIANSIDLLPVVKTWVREDGEWISQKVYSWPNSVLLPRWIEIWSRSSIAYWPFDNDDFLYYLWVRLGRYAKIRNLFTDFAWRFTVVPHVGSLSSFGFLK